MQAPDESFVLGRLERGGLVGDGFEGELGRDLLDGCATGEVEQGQPLPFDGARGDASRASSSTAASARSATAGSIPRTSTRASRVTPTPTSTGSGRGATDGAVCGGGGAAGVCAVVSTSLTSVTPLTGLTLSTAVLALAMASSCGQIPRYTYVVPPPATSLNRTAR